MSTTVRQALGDMSSAGDREVGGGVVDQHRGQAEGVRSPRRRRRAICSGSRMSQVTVSTWPPSASTDFPPGVEMLGLAAGDDDVGAEAGELGGDGLAEPGAAAGDEHARAVEGAVAAGPAPDGRAVRAVRIGSVMFSSPCSAAGGPSAAGRLELGEIR